MISAVQKAIVLSIAFVIFGCDGDGNRTTDDRPAIPANQKSTGTELSGEKAARTWIEKADSTGINRKDGAT